MLRWEIETFFGWWKRHLKVYHLISRNRHGLLLQLLSGLFTHGANSGSAYLFIRNGNTWKEQAKFTAKHAAKGDNFGFAVSIRANRAIVGAPWRDDGGDFSGAAHSVLRADTFWTQKAKVTAKDAVRIGRFGHSVSVSENFAIVAANGRRSKTGAAYVYDDEEDLGVPFVRPVEPSLLIAITLRRSSARHTTSKLPQSV